jgi:hypothetical protein
MVEAVSHRSLTLDDRVRERFIRCVICGGRSGTGTGFLELFGFLLSIPFYRGSPY